MEAGEDLALEIGWDQGTAGSPVVSHVFDPGAIARELGRRNLQLAREAEISKREWMWTPTFSLPPKEH
jgi:hypothetical protein